MIDLDRITGFEWDVGNARKSHDKHAVTQREAEQVFFRSPLFLVEDVKLGQRELRIHAYGVTDEGRRLHVTFTLRGRGTLIRVISARDMSARERTWHASQSTDDEDA